MLRSESISNVPTDLTATQVDPQSQELDWQVGTEGIESQPVENTKKEVRAVDPKKRMVELINRKITIKTPEGKVFTLGHFRVLGESFDLYFFEGYKEYSAELPVKVYTATSFAQELGCKLVRKQRKSKKNTD